ncbi:uncharacterized protein LOC109856101 [Pseudomyrmex gracilis]|uniref:uncharacterized protein LOC109856101 n=1 Tax=Pseudomyrmex gracilis TaxID=219809 RepID=UPI00099541DF|nr:uncharacterized protein LOC109856101 [Pseudomyrmex gracilis]
MTMEKIHIDEAQPLIDEHINCLIEDDSAIDCDLKDVTPDDLPDWYDGKLYKEAQRFYRRNILSINAQNFVGLLSILAIPSILKVLIYTKQHDTPCAAFKRYLQTTLHIVNLYKNDINVRDSNWYKTINTIRWKHGTNNKRSQCARVGPIYNRDMAFTQCAFVGHILTSAKTIGLHNTPEEDEAITHFWRVNGYMLGIPDRLNVCRKNADETRDLCQKINDKVYKKYLSEAPPEFYDTVTTTINGLWCVDPFLNTDAIIALTLKLYGLEYKSLGWYSRINLEFRIYLFKLFHQPYIGTILREFNNYFLIGLLWISEHFPVLAWMNFGKTNSQINLYPKYK